ncbi:MAG: chromosome segregation protein SMC, partial [Pseudomonadota bacterium]
AYAEVTLTLDNSDRLAPASLNATDRIDIVRRITRDTGSVFRANGKELRARDVQMLFADASTGSHSPALVRQGQIGELISARPKARRRILEEAAGISGLYQRRHEAELKLQGTEANLTRVQDVLDQLDQQIIALARQAKQAARYREIAAALRRAEQVALFVAWHEAARDHAAADAACAGALREAGQAEAAASAAGRARDAAEARLPPLREEEAVAGAIWQRATIELAQTEDAAAQAETAIASLAARIEELDRDAAREAALDRDAEETTTRLTWEDSALSTASDGQDAARDAAEAKVAATQGTLSAAEAEHDRLAAAAAQLAARRKTAETQRDETHAAHAAAARALEEVSAGLATQGTEEAAARDARLSAQAARDAAQKNAEDAETALGTAEAARALAQTREAETRSALAAQAGNVKALEAEIAGLDRLLSAKLTERDGLIDQVAAAPGIEPALGAALGDDLLVPEATSEGAEGWHVLAPLAPLPPMPAGTEPLSAHVTVPACLARRISQTALVSDAEGSALWRTLGPGQRLVSREGRLWRWDGLHSASRDTGAAAALRLAQRNRRSALDVELAAAREAAAGALSAHETERVALDTARRDETEARSARKAADAALAEATRRCNLAETEEGRLAGRREALTAALARREEELALALAARDEAEAALGGAESLADEQAALAAAQEAARTALDPARHEMLAARAAADELRRAGEARTRRRRDIAQELATWQRRRENVRSRLDDLSKRRATAQTEYAEAKARPAGLAEARDRLAGAVADAQARRRAAADALAEAEAALREANATARDAERSASTAREGRARADALREAAALRLDEAARRIVEETGAQPDALRETLGLTDDRLPGREACEIEISRLTRQREAMGAVNLRADQDRQDILAEQATLAAEKDDLEAAITKLRLGIAELNREGRQRLLAAFEEVNRNFSALFRHLFGGGEANLVLVESEDPLDAGLEIMCMPPGKKLSTLSLLSGGEQSLTAISLIFAVFLAKPAPICVLDEVDAPLDDANVTRFCDLLDEMARRTETRFLIITHHAITMSRVNRLFGVTMAERGVSQLVSVDLTNAAELVEGG